MGKGKKLSASPVPPPPHEYNKISEQTALCLSRSFTASSSRKGGTGGVAFPTFFTREGPWRKFDAATVPPPPHEYSMTPGQTALSWSRSYIDHLLRRQEEKEAARAVEYVASLYARLAG
ncbi:15978_t:CDS:2 [Funneliformis geosporum]|nr:15978_t:CDS:2 [Funneliformis geosporum]